MPIDLVVGLLMAVTAFGQLALVAEDLGGGSSSRSSSHAGPSGRGQNSKEAQRRSRARRQHASKFDPAVPYEPRHHQYPSSLSQGYPTTFPAGLPASSRSSSCGSSASSSSDSSERSLSFSPPRSILKRRDPVHVHVPLPPTQDAVAASFRQGYKAGRRKSDPSVAFDGLSVGRDSHRGLGLAVGADGNGKGGRRRVAFEDGLPF